MKLTKTENVICLLLGAVVVFTAIMLVNVAACELKEMPHCAQLRAEF